MSGVHRQLPVRRSSGGTGNVEGGVRLPDPDREPPGRPTIGPWTMLGCRQHLFLFTRLHARSHMLAAPGRWSTRRRTAATAGALVLDLMMARMLARRQGFGVRTRLALDVSEAILWGHFDRTPGPLVALLGVPLAAEAGTRESRATVTLPLVHAVVGLLGRTDQGMTQARMAGAIPLTAALGGVAAGRYEVKLRQQARQSLSQRADALQEQQRLAGMNSVAMGADSIVDLLSRTVPLLGAGGDRDIVARSLTAWKGWLAETSQQQATYLDTALRRWEHHHNQNPDLRADVAVDVDAGDGTILLSHYQALELERLLQRGGLRGRVRVRLADPSRRYRPGAAMRLDVNGSPLRIPKDPDRSIPAMDFGPLALAITAAASVLTGLNSGGRPRRRLWAGALAQGLAAVWAHDQMVRHGHNARGRVLAGAVGTAALQTILVAPAQTGQPESTGIERLPFIVGLIGPLSQSVFYGSDAAPLVQLATLGVLSALVIGGLAVTPGQYRWSDIAASLTTPLDLAGPGYFVRRSTQTEAAAASHAWHARQAGDAERWYEDGRQIVIDLVSDAVVDAWSALARVAATLPPSLEGEARRRLLEAERRLSDLRQAGNWPLSPSASLAVVNMGGPDGKQ